MRDFAFSPAAVEIAVGGAVRFVNRGRAPHTATATGGGFDTGIVSSGESSAQRFPEAGTFAFTCSLHPKMTGTVRVVSAADRATGPASGSVTPSGAATAGETTEDAAVDEQRTGGDASDAPGASAVEIRDDGFAPDRLEVVAGSTVVWTNAGRAVHTATATDGSFDSGMVASGATWELTLDRPGTYTYRCELHPEMEGEVRVVAAGATGVAEVAAGDTTRAAAASSRGPSTVAMQILVLGIFALGLAAFTVASARFATNDRP